MSIGATSEAMVTTPVLKMYRSNRDRQSLTDKVRVAFYGRVSTLHEEQQNAFENQMEWYQQLLKNHPNWQLIQTYSDKATGTQTKKRDGFMQMICDAKTDKFDLIITREVCRFARNTVDSLYYTRELKKVGVEVYFFNDGVWSLDSDGELRLTIFSALAQDESRKCSERVHSAMKILPEKGSLMGNGNILGYTLVKGSDATENTYIIDEEDAETVRLIYKWYLEGDGYKKIISRLIAEQRKNTIDKVSWHPRTIGRILQNKTYAGYKCYNKSTVVDYLEHTRKNNTDENTYIYVKGDWEPIVSLEDWEEAQRIRRSRSKKMDGRSFGSKSASDKWSKKLICQCGRRYKRYKWRTKKNGREIFGYQCANQAEHRKKSFHIDSGGTGEGFCNVGGICHWKLELQCQKVLSYIWENPVSTIKALVDAIEENYVVEETATIIPNTTRLENEKKRLEARLVSLEDKWLDGKIENTRYEKKKEEIESRVLEIEEKLCEYQRETEEETIQENRQVNIAEITALLENCIDFTKETVSEELVDILIERVTPTEEGIYRWYLNLGGASQEERGFDERDYTELHKFTITFDEAREYQKQHDSILRIRQWKDIEVAVYIRA